MTRIAGIALLATLLAAPAFADDLARAKTYFAQAEHQMEVAGELEGLPRLRSLQRAKPRYTWARQRALDGLAQDDLRDHETLQALADLERKATQGLVTILNAETAHYLAGGARDLARARNDEALELAPEDGLALSLQKAIEAPPPAPEKKKLKAPKTSDTPPPTTGDEFWLRRRLPFVRLTPFERRLLARRGLLPGFDRPAPALPPAAPSYPRIQPAPQGGGFPQAPFGQGAARSLPSR